MNKHQRYEMLARTAAQLERAVVRGLGWLAWAFVLAMVGLWIYEAHVRH